MKKLFFSGVFLILLSLFGGVYSAQAASGDNIFGYGWSDTIGWISFNNCEKPTVAVTGAMGLNCNGIDYGVTTDGNGVMSGYAWSDNIGWISFSANDVKNCPISPCTPTIDQTTGNVTGWARALTAVGRTDGWDGWISLSKPAGTPFGDYGVSVSTLPDPLTNLKTFSGYAWGDEVVGWVDMGAVAINDNLMTLTLEADSVLVGQGTGNFTTLRWSVSNATTCDSDHNNTTNHDNPWRNMKSAEIMSSGIAIDTKTSLPFAGSIAPFTWKTTGIATGGYRTYTITCTNPGGSITRSVTINAMGLTLASQNICALAGTSPTILWTPTRATECQATNGWSGTFPAVDGQTYSSNNASPAGPVGVKRYTLQCFNRDFTPAVASNKLNLDVRTCNPDFSISAGRGRMIAANKPGQIIKDRIQVNITPIELFSDTVILSTAGEVVKKDATAPSYPVQTTFYDAATGGSVITSVSPLPNGEYPPVYVDVRTVPVPPAIDPPVIPIGTYTLGIIGTSPNRSHTVNAELGILTVVPWYNQI